MVRFLVLGYDVRQPPELFNDPESVRKPPTSPIIWSYEVVFPFVGGELPGKSFRAIVVVG